MTNTNYPPRKVLVALPPAMLTLIDFIAKEEHRTRSDLIREALRRYIESFKRTNYPAVAVTTSGIGSNLAARDSGSNGAGHNPHSNPSAHINLNEEREGLQDR